MCSVSLDFLKWNRSISVLDVMRTSKSALVWFSDVYSFMFFVFILVVVCLVVSTISSQAIDWEDPFKESCGKLEIISAYSKSTRHVFDIFRDVPGFSFLDPTGAGFTKNGRMPDLPRPGLKSDTSVGIFISAK